MFNSTNRMNLALTFSCVFLSPMTLLKLLEEAGHSKQGIPLR